MTTTLDIVLGVAVIVMVVVWAVAIMRFGAAFATAWKALHAKPNSETTPGDEPSV